VTSQVPPTIKVPFSDEVDEQEEDLDVAKWFCYPSANDQPLAWQGLFTMTNHEKSKLISIIQDTTIALYDEQAEQISADCILQLYGRFVTWRNNLPSEIRNVERDNGKTLPHVLSLLILYSTSIILLLRPLLDYEGFPSYRVEERVWALAQEGLTLLDEHYRRLYTCRYQPVLQMFAVLHLADVVARFFPESTKSASKTGPKALQLGMQLLMQSRPGFPAAGILQEMLRRTAKECAVRFPWDVSDTMFIPEPDTQCYQLDDFIRACTKPTCLQPHSQIHRRYLPSFSADWAARARRFGFPEPVFSVPGSRRLSVEETGAQALMQLRTWPNSISEGNERVDGFEEMNLTIY